MTPQEQTILSLLRPDSAHRETIRNMFGLSSRLEAERARLKADRNISDIGRRGKEAELAKSLIKNLAELTQPLRRAKADIAAKRAAIKVPEVDKTDVVGESKRQEIRTFIRSLPLAEKTPALEGFGDAGRLAILDAPALLSGLPEDRYEHVKSTYLAGLFNAL